MNFNDLKVGDKVTRVLCGKDMTMLVRYVEETLLYCAVEEHPNWSKEELWRFDRDTGVEEDPDLGWGVKFGRTGSYLRHIGG